MNDSTNSNPPPLRDSLIATAVAFLKNDKVRSSSLDEKKAFLENKGMTPVEIEESIRICDLPSNNYPPPLPPSLPYPSTLSRLSSSFSTALLLLGSSYAVYQLYQKFLKPLLFGEELSREKEVLQQLLSNSKKMNDNLVAMVATLNDLHRQGARSNSQLLLNNNSQEYKLATNEMKDEVRSLKALLLSRNQFPTVPCTTTPSLPAWQIGLNSTKTNKIENAIVNGDGDDSDGDDGDGDDDKTTTKTTS